MFRVTLPAEAGCDGPRVDFYWASGLLPGVERGSVA
ncbi:MAG: hypothetical protein KatS3mg110_1673 [Pirellulaceae bacterium]|nr:MAG: hypothetical protein KatS3mg110_1673 [Pirellulaceae bacterium]